MKPNYSSSIPPLLGWLLLLIALGNVATQYGHRWEVGGYGVPRFLVAPDGEHFADGSRIDPISRLLIANECEEEVSLFLLAFMVVCLLLAIRIRRDTERKRQELQRHQAELRQLSERSS